MRIILTTGTLCGREYLALASSIIEDAAKANRMLAVFAQITNNAASPELLETSPEASFPAGSGATLYAALNTVASTLNQLAATMAPIDQG